MATHDLTLKCKCSKVRGHLKKISPSHGNHIKCMCIDCQTFAHYLGANDRVLDKNGGTEIFQTSPSNIEFLEGREHVKCLRLSPKGTTRWFASCCNTPIANTISLKKDFAGVILDCVDFEESKITKDQAMGPIKYHLMAKYCLGEPPKDSYQEFPKHLVFKMMFKILYGSLTKAYLPNPFFNEQDGSPIPSPLIVDKNKRKEIKSKILASS